MKFLKKLAKAVLLVFPVVFLATPRNFAFDTGDMPDSPTAILSTTPRGSFGYRRPSARVNPKTWSGLTSKYTVQMYHRTCYRILVDGNRYLVISINRSVSGVCYSIINEDTNVCTHKIYDRSGGALYEMKSLGTISHETNFAQMSRNSDGNWVITPFSAEGELLNSWGYTVRPRPHRPCTNDIMRDGEVMSTVTVSGFDFDIQSVILLLAGTLLK